MAVSVLTQTLYADLEDLRTRVRPETLLECFDWNRDGQIELVPVMEVLQASSTDIAMALQTAGSIYPNFTSPYPPALRDLALDGCLWRIGAKYPTYYIIDHITLRHDTEGKLTKVRTGKLTLGVAPPEPSAIQGGALFPDPSTLQQPPPIFANNGTRKWGIF